MELISYGQLDNQSGCCFAEERYQVRWDVYGAVDAVALLVGDGADDHVRCFLLYNSYNVYIGRNNKKFYCTFNYF